MPLSETLVSQHRSDLVQLTSIADENLSRAWLKLGADIEAGLLDVLPGLIDLYGSAASTLGADWYDEMRDAAGVSGQFSGIAAELPDAGRAPALVGWATSEATSPEALLKLVSGGLQMTIADLDRQSVAVSSIEDPKADGWQRVARGAGCPFCVMLAGRGEVYTKSAADFSSHGHCHCVAVSAFSGHERPVKPYTPSLKQSSDADRVRVRDWIAANPQ